MPGFGTGLNTTEKYLEQILGRGGGCVCLHCRQQKGGKGLKLHDKYGGKQNTLKAKKTPTLCGSESRRGFFGESFLVWVHLGGFFFWKADMSYHLASSLL